MRQFARKNEGFTLIELLVTVLTGSLVTLAATSVLILGLRIYRSSLDTVSRQGILRVALSVLEDMSSGKKYELESAATGNAWSMKQEPAAGAAEGETVLSYDPAQQAILSGGGTVLVEDVTNSKLTQTADHLYSFDIEIEGDGYTTTVYGRTQEDNWQVLDEMDHAEGRRLLTSILSYQVGSLGTIRLEEGRTGITYTKWYNSDWEDYTPWCSSFVSWAIAQCVDENGVSYLKDIPRQANVNKLFAELFLNQKIKDDGALLTSFYKAKGTEGFVPQVGDLVFFDRNNDASQYTTLLTSYDITRLNLLIELIDLPKFLEDNLLGDGFDHVGIVVDVDGNDVYTIEGNVGVEYLGVVQNPKVMIRKYDMTDVENKIAGYALLDWK